MGKIKTLGRYEDPEVNKISSQQFESDYERSSMAQAKVFSFLGTMKSCLSIPLILLPLHFSRQSETVASKECMMVPIQAAAPVVHYHT